MSVLPATADPRASGSRMSPRWIASGTHGPSTAQEVVAALGSDADRGLDPDEARRRLITHGPNELEERAATSAWRLLAEQFTNAMILVLLGAAAITAAIGDLKDTAIILVIVALNGIIGFVQEYRAEQAMERPEAHDQPVSARRSCRRHERRPGGRARAGRLVRSSGGRRDRRHAPGRGSVPPRSTRPP